MNMRNVKPGQLVKRVVQGEETPDYEYEIKRREVTPKGYVIVTATRREINNG